MKLLFATSKGPDKTRFVPFCEALRGFAKEVGLEIPPGIIYTYGPGCWNLGFSVEGDSTVIDQFGKELCMALMPAKWCETKDSLPEVDTYELD